MEQEWAGHQQTCNVQKRDRTDTSACRKHAVSHSIPDGLMPWLFVQKHSQYGKNAVIGHLLLEDRLQVFVGVCVCLIFKKSKSLFNSQDRPTVNVNHRPNKIQLVCVSLGFSENQGIPIHLGKGYNKYP